MNQLDRIPFSALGAEQAFQDAGIELRQARALATQIELAANAGGFVTNEQLTSALSSLKLEIIDRMARGEAETRSLIAENRDLIAASKAETRSLIAENRDLIAASETETRSLIAENRDLIAASKAETRSLIAENRDLIVTSVSDLHNRISRTEKELREHMATLLWRFFGGMVAMATLFFAAVRYLP